MATLCHAWSNRRRQTDGAARSLGIGRSQNLKDGIPTYVDVGVGGLSMVFSVGSDDETVIGMNITSFVNSVITGAETPNGISSLVAVVEVVLVMMLRAGWQSEVHQVCDGSLAFPTVDGSHGSHLGHGVFVDQAGFCLLLVALPE